MGTTFSHRQKITYNVSDATNKMFKDNTYCVPVMGQSEADEICVSRDKLMAEIQTSCLRIISHFATFSCLQCGGYLGELSGLSF